MSSWQVFFGLKTDFLGLVLAHAIGYLLGCLDLAHRCSLFWGGGGGGGADRGEEEVRY